MRLGNIAAFVLVVPTANAWGNVGHRTIGYLAEKHLSPKAAALCDDLLANNRGFDISDAACWADTQKFPMPWSRGFHFISKHAACWDLMISTYLTKWFGQTLRAMTPPPIAQSSGRMTVPQRRAVSFLPS